MKHTLVIKISCIDLENDMEIATHSRNSLNF
jgi:hypothetical protein